MWTKILIYPDGKLSKNFNNLSNHELSQEREGTGKAFSKRFSWVCLFEQPDVLVDYNSDQILCIYVRKT